MPHRVALCDRPGLGSYFTSALRQLAILTDIGRSTVTATAYRAGAYLLPFRSDAPRIYISNPHTRFECMYAARLTKLGDFDSIPRRENERLVEQIKAMQDLTRSPKVLFVAENGFHRALFVASGTYIARGEHAENIPLADYFVRRVLPTLDGDTRPVFVSGVQDSRLAQLRVEARIIRAGTRG